MKAPTVTAVQRTTLVLWVEWRKGSSAAESRALDWAGAAADGAAGRRCGENHRDQDGDEEGEGHANGDKAGEGALPWERDGGGRGRVVGDGSHDGGGKAGRGQEAIVLEGEGAGDIGVGEGHKVRVGAARFHWASLCWCAARRAALGRAAGPGGGAREFGAQQLAGAEEPGLDGAFGDFEGAGGGGDILLVEIEEEDGVAIFGGQGEDGAAEGLIAGSVFEGGAGQVRVRRLGDVVKRERNGGQAAELGAVDIGSQGKEPGGEGGIAAELGEVAPGAEEGFLGHFFGAAAVAAIAPGEIDERALPAANDGFKGRRIAGEDARDGGFVGEGCGLARVRGHSLPGCGTRNYGARFQNVCRGGILKKFTTENGRARRDLI